MKSRQSLFLLLFVVLATALSVVHAGDVGSDAIGEADPIDSDSDEWLQRNPGYGASDQESESYDSDSGDETDDEEDDNAKTALAEALSKSRKAPRSTMKLLKKHRTRITVAVALYAFRREIFLVILHFFGTTMVDPDTGVVSRRLKLKPTSVLKILVFVELMRRIESADSPSGQSSASMVALLFGGRQGLMFVQAISALLERASNPSYVPPIEQHYTFERLNERYMKDFLALQKAMEPAKQNWPPQKKLDMPTSLFGSKAAPNSQIPTTYNSTVILFDLTGLDTSLSRKAELSDKVSFLLNQHRAKILHPCNNATATNGENNTGAELEVIITLESPGGSASDYGLAAQEILRLRDEPGITLTICCDKVAASGGYMMACASSPGRLFAAPFAIVGSIGVVGQTLNVHDALENWGVKPIVFRGGKHKAPLGLIGEVTDDAIATVQGMIDKTHDAFKRHVLTSRPLVAQHLENVATGEVWLGADALEVGLVDRVVTSAEYIGERMRGGARVLKLINYDKRHFPFGHDAARGPWTFLTKSLSTRVTELRRVMSQVSHVLKEVVVGEHDGFAISAASKSFGVSDIGTRTSGMQ